MNYRLIQMKKTLMNLGGRDCNYIFNLKTNDGLYYINMDKGIYEKIDTANNEFETIEINSDFENLFFSGNKNIEPVIIIADYA